MKLFVKLLLVVWVTLITTGRCQQKCRVQDGAPGLVGVVGRNGLPGQKGQKGEPLYQDQPMVLRGLKGERGNRGEPGEMGVKGFRGDPGTKGIPGPPGRKGSSSDVISGAQNKQSAFSAIMSENSNLQSPVIFTKFISKSTSEFDLTTGYFTCNIPGVYYFVFHATSVVNLCLVLKWSSEEPSKDLYFCDYNVRKFKQVLSGGAVLHLSKNQRVSVHQLNKPSSKPAGALYSVVFNGFLIFPD